MKLILSAVCFVVCLGAVTSSSLVGLEDFPDIKRIRSRTPKEVVPRSQARSILSATSPDAAPALEVLSHLAQSRSLQPRRRKVNRRSGLAPLPLEPRPEALPFEGQHGDSSPDGLAVYRPRPELRPLNLRKPSFDLNRGSEVRGIPVTSKRVTSEDALTPIYDPRRRPRPAPEAYVEDDVIYRGTAGTEDTEESQVYPPVTQDQKGELATYEEGTPDYHTPDPVRSAPRPGYRGDSPVLQRQPPVYEAEPEAPNARPSFKRRNRVRARPQYQQQEFEFAPVPEKPERIRGPEIQDRPHRVIKTDLPEEIRQLVRPEQSLRPEQPYRPEVPERPYSSPDRDFSRRPQQDFAFPKNQHPINRFRDSESTGKFSPLKSGSRLRSPATRRRRPYQRLPAKITEKLPKTKKLSAFRFDPSGKEIKKDKRAVYGGGGGGGHLDQNGIEFVEEAKKVERDGNSNGRMAFQIHGQQGPHSYKFGYDTGKGSNRQFRYEEKDGYGEVKGRYGYYDKHGKLQVVNYSAHPKHGFTADVPKH